MSLLPPQRSLALQHYSAPHQRVPGNPVAALQLPSAPFVGSDSISRSLMEYCEIVWRRKAILIWTVVVCTGAAFGIVRLQPRVYRATASVLFQKPPEVIALGATDPMDTSSVETSFQTQVELFQSNALLKRVVAKLNHGKWAYDASKPAPRTPELLFVAKGLKVTPMKGTRLIRIQAESHDRQLAATFANSVISEYIQQEHEAESNRAESGREWLNQQVTQLRQTIEASEKNLVSYASKNGLAFTTEKDKSPDSRLLRLQDELSKSQVERFAAESRYEMAAKTSSDAVSDVFESGPVRDYQAKLTEVRRQLAEASSLWTPNHYKVKQLEAQVAVLKAAIDKEHNEVIARTKNDYTSALRREQLLSIEYLNAVRAVTDQANRAIHYNLLRRDLDRDRELYDGIVQKVKQVGITSGLRPTAVHLVDAAEPPLRPEGPNVALTSYLALICSTFLGVLVIMIRESAGSTLQEPGDAAQYLNVNELGTIPSQRALRPRIWTNRADPNPGSMSFKNLNVLSGADRGVTSVEFATWNQTNSLTAQCFRATLASILFSYHTRTAEKIHSIVVTSATVGEGKTTVVSNLGLALARMGRRVLLIDADYEKPRLHTIFSTPNTTGLREIVEGSGEISLRDVVQKTNIPGLYLLQSGATQGGFPEILQSSRIAELMHVAEREFDFVLIDTPPVLHLPDARIWGRLADGLVLVVRAGATNRQRAWSAVHRLTQDEVPFLGTVLNDWDSKNSSAYEYYSPSAGVYPSK